VRRETTSCYAATFRRLCACRNGGTAVETAIILPVLALAIIGTIMEGWVLFSTNVLFYAVESAARCAAVNTTTCGGTTQAKQISAVQTYAVSQAWGLNVTAANFSVTQPANGCGWRVSYNYSFNFVMPFQNDFAVNVPASACYPAQQ